MAEELVFEIKTDSVEQSLANLTKSTNELKEANKLLAKEVAAGNKEAAVAIERNNAVIKVQQDEYRTLQNNLKGYLGAKKQEVDTTNFSNNSIKANRELLKQLTAQYIGLKNPSQEATNQIKRLSDTLKQQEAVIGDTRRNVGNYAEGFKDAIGGIVSGIPGLKGFQTAQLGVNAAMNANPAGAVVLAFQAVVEIFKSNAEVADTVTFALDGLTKGFGFIIDTIVDTVTSFDNLTEAILHPIDFLEKLATGTFNAAKEGYNASKALDDFTVANARTAAAIAENDIQVQALTKSLKDKTKSEQERIKIANQIADIEIKNTELSKKLAADELAAEQLKLKGRTLTAEQQAKLIELESKVKQAAAEADIVRAQRQTRINILLEKEAAAASKEIKTDLASVEKELTESRLKLQEDSLKKDLELFELNFKDKEKQLKDQGATEAQIAEIKNNEIAAINKKWHDIELNQLGRYLQQDEKDRKSASEQLAQNAQLQTELENLLFDESVDRQTRQAEIDRQFAESGFATFKEFYDYRKKVYDEDAKAKLQADALKQQSEKATISAVQSSADSIIGLIGQVADAQGAGAEFQKALAFTQVLIQQALAIANAVVGATSAGSQTGIAAVATTPAFIATLVGAVTSIFGSIIGIFSEAETPKFATGVIGLNGPGTETSDSIPAYLSKGESVMTAKATKVFAPMLAQMEMAVGNKPNWDFSSGHFANGVIGTYGDGGSYVRDVAKGVTDQLTNASMRQLLRELPQPVLAVKDYVKVQKSYEKSVAVKEG